MRCFSLIALAIILGPCTSAQTVKGKLFGMQGTEKEMLPFGMVRWLGQDTGVLTNENGVFELNPIGASSTTLIASKEGYLSDTIVIGSRAYISITLRQAPKKLHEATVTDRSGAYISSIQVTQTEVINQNELSKAACCDLAGCFGTQASVQPQTTNVVTNAQELRILGLSGVYNQVLVDGFPMIQGLSYTYGISTYPGTTIDNIYVSKGTTSVAQGYEGMSGQINLVSRTPEKADPLLLNAYLNSFGELHLNTTIAAPIGKSKKWHSLLALHTVQPAGHIDGNQDGFLDLPLLTRYMAAHKWTYNNPQKKGLALQIGLRMVYENRVGGQNNFDPKRDEGSNKIYGQHVQYQQPEATLKASYRINENMAIVLQSSAFAQNQDTWLGTTHYTAHQKSAYVNLQQELQWRKQHALKYGLSYRYQALQENIQFTDTSLPRGYAGTYQTPLSVPGLFAENTFHWAKDRITLITGVRIDQHQTWGWNCTPRAMLKYAINSQHTLRASAGKGWRQVNLFSEHTNLLASARDLLFLETLKPEVAYNWGGSHTYRFAKGITKGTITLDFYSTHFTNQFFPDYDQDATKIIIKNFEGVSRSKGMQLEGSFTFKKQIEVRMAYNYLSVYRVVQGAQTQLPFNARNRAMAALSYHTKNNRWQADANTHWFDKMRLPPTASNPLLYRRPDYSTPYATINMQITYRWKELELYAGCENMTQFRQPNAIISAENPFSPYFDLSSVWGPTRGREGYVGVRYHLK